MTRTDKALCWAYGLLALAALVGTQWALIDFLRSDDNGMGDLLDGITANPAATFTTIDLGVVALVAVIFMIVEGRRLRLPLLWLYIVLVFVVAVSVAFPLFLIARTRLLAAERVSAPS